MILPKVTQLAAKLEWLSQAFWLPVPPPSFPSTFQQPVLLYTWGIAA